MGTAVGVLVVVGLIAAAAAGAVVLARRRAETSRRRVEDALADARRWVERLGGQVLNLVGTNTAAQQALADASERFTAAGSQLDLARSLEQARLVTDTALEGLYYVRAARVAMDLDPGPALPDDARRRDAGVISEHRKVEVEGQTYETSPQPGPNTPHFYPGGDVGGRPVPQGWYSQPWWKTALVGGAAGLGAAAVFGSMFASMPGLTDMPAGHPVGDPGPGMDDGGFGSGFGGFADFDDDI